MFVLDVSIVAPWVLPDEQNAIADAAFLQMQREGAVVPELWSYEVGNMLISNERRKRIALKDSEGILLDLASYPIEIDSEKDLEHTLALARHYDLTFYDAAYLELAMRRKMPLATLDRELARAAVKAKVQVLAA